MQKPVGITISGEELKSLLDNLTIIKMSVEFHGTGELNFIVQPEITKMLKILKWEK